MLLNPGLSPSDYYGEFKVKKFKKVLLNNLKQRWLESQMTFLFLDPQFSWHEGFKWWNEKLIGVMEKSAQFWHVDLVEARRRLATQLASIELFPYHSKSFGSAKLLRDLESAKLARNFIKEYVMPRVNSGDAIVVVTRKMRDWNIKRTKGVVQYSPQEARAAHLTPDSPGGSAIFEHLKKVYKTKRNFKS